VLGGLVAGLKVSNLKSNSRKKVQLDVQRTVAVLERYAGAIEVGFRVFTLTLSGYKEIDNLRFF